MNDWRRVLLLVFSGILIFGVHLDFKANDSDAFLHINIGRHIVQKGFPDSDPFSFTASKQWIQHEWLADILFYRVYSLGGIAGLLVLKAFLVTLSAGLLFFILRGTLYLRLILVLLVALPLAHYSLIRPELFFWLFLMMLFALIVLRNLIFIPFLFLLWANIHASVIIGLGVLFAFFLQHLRRKKYALIFLASIAASAINPNGYTLFFYPFTLLPYRSFVNEWTPYPVSSGWFWFFLFLTLSVLIVFVLRMMYSKGVPLSYWLLFLFFAYFGFSSKRGVFVSLFVMAFLLNLAHLWPHRLLKRSPSHDWAALIVLFSLFLVMISQFHAFDISTADSNLPFGAIAYLKQHAITGNFYNEYSYGGLLFQTPISVFIDGRIGIYSLETLFDYYRINHAEDVDARVLHYGISGFVIPLHSPLSTYLDSHPSWKIIYTDNISAIFVRK